MSLKPWREIARPHKDVLEGTFKQSEFAADITQVANGTATPEYQDAENFFSRTFITEGMRLLLVSVAQRLAGLGGDPVIQLQTAFGGGKTHTMLAVLHLACRKVSTDKLAGIPPLLDQAGITELPHANIAVLDGIAMSVSQGKQHGTICTNTLWGEMAWQLLGEEGYNLVAASDRDGTAPGKDVLAKLLTKSAPCVVLIDELQKFFSDLTPGKQLNAGTYEANLKFVQALTEAFKTVPNAILLASLPESETEVGDSFGQKTLVALEKHFGRVESVWKPVATEEAFEIVRRRLFESAGERAQIEGISRQFWDYYRQNARHFPLETQSNEYFERMCSSYPIHPEIFDRLYEDWSTLDKFQRTRGVLQYMAVIIHRLWNDNNQDALIMPGSIPLDDSLVRNKSIHYLPQGWEPVLEREVDGYRSEPHRIDGDDTRFGSVQAAHRVMRAVFLGSAPSTSDQVVKGIQLERVLLGTVQPGQTVGVFEDVLKRLRDRLHYLYSDQDRFWLDTKPNLRREMESRKQNIDKLTLHDELKRRVSHVFGRNSIFAGVHVFTNSVDVPDDYGFGPRLVVLSPSEGYTKIDGNNAINAAEKILAFRGDQPRQKRNRLIFFAPDTDIVGRLNEAGRTYLAWKEIVNDINEGKLNLDLFQAKLAKKNTESAEKMLQQMVRESYKWILCPMQFKATDKSVDWESVAVSTNSANLIQEIENRLREEEWIISEWSPIHLKSLLTQWYFKEGVKDVNGLKVYQDTCHYLYLPRLINDQVYRNAIGRGLESEDFFGFASGKDGDRYLGFCFGKGGIPTLDGACVLIDKDTAIEYRERTKPAPIPIQVAQPKDNPSTSSEDLKLSPSLKHQEAKTSSPIQTAIKKQFYGNIDLDPVKAKMDFATIVDEVVQQFTAKLGVEVSISVEIQAKFKDGFDESIQRTIKENCKVLRFSSSEFEEE
ncbi:MAG: ATP-binding protein [Moraxellaceae bacterium]|nr:ATP-binding protein [Pseudomonadales bacterium]MCP5175211.1 ATP-binding protein [Moraxellaceae bacterium]